MAKCTLDPRGVINRMGGSKIPTTKFVLALYWEISRHTYRDSSRTIEMKKRCPSLIIMHWVIQQDSYCPSKWSLSLWLALYMIIQIKTGVLLKSGCWGSYAIKSLWDIFWSTLYKKLLIWREKNIDVIFFLGYYPDLFSFLDIWICIRSGRLL